MNAAQNVLRVDDWANLRRAIMESKTPSPAADPSRQLLRHTLATLAYRGGKTLRGAPETFCRIQHRRERPYAGANPGPHGRPV